MGLTALDKVLISILGLAHQGWQTSCPGPLHLQAWASRSQKLMLVHRCLVVDADFCEIGHELIKSNRAGLVLVNFRKPWLALQPCHTVAFVTRRTRSSCVRIDMPSQKHANDLTSTSEWQSGCDFQQEPLPRARSETCALQR